MKIKFAPLTWTEIQTHGRRKLYAKAAGLEWRIDPHNGSESDFIRIERDQLNAQREYEAFLSAHILAVDTDNFHLQVLEKIFGKVDDSIWADILAGRILPPQPKEEILERMGLRHKTPILNADDKGNVTVVTPTAKDRAVDRLIQEHKQLSADHRTAADKGQVGLTQQLRERLKSIETALAIAVKEGEVVSDKSKEG